MTKASPAQDVSPAEYPRPFVTVDLVIFTLREGQLQVLLMQRAAPPFEGMWALPGGYIRPDEDESLDGAAARILGSKTAVATPYIEQLQGFGNARRDPRGWTATFAYFALIASEQLALQSGANADDVAWHPVETRPLLAFDHDLILRMGLERLRGKVEYTILPAHLLPAKFTLPDLQSVYEQILGRRLDKSAFRKKMADAGVLEPVPGEMRHASNRPSQLYRVRSDATPFLGRTI